MLTKASWKTGALCLFGFVSMSLLTYFWTALTDAFHFSTDRWKIFLIAIVIVVVLSSFFVFFTQSAYFPHAIVFSISLPHFMRQCNTVIPGRTTWSTHVGTDLPRSATLCPFTAPDSVISVQLLLGPIVGALLYAAVFGTVAAAVGLTARQLFDNRTRQP